MHVHIHIHPHTYTNTHAHTIKTINTHKHAHNLQIADFSPAEICWPVREVEVITSKFFLNKEHKQQQQRRDYISADCISRPISVVMLLGRAHKPHLVAACVVLLGILQNGDKLVILWVPPATPA